MDQYRDMYDLFNHEKDARNYYDSLPAYVRDQIATRSGNVNSFENLRDYAENLLRGDD